MQWEEPFLFVHLWALFCRPSPSPTLPIPSAHLVLLPAKSCPLPALPQTLTCFCGGWGSGGCDGDVPAGLEAGAGARAASPSLTSRPSCLADVNECELMLAVCGAALCENVEGSFLCLCASDLEEYDAQEGRCRPRGAGGEPRAPPSRRTPRCLAYAALLLLQLLIRGVGRRASWGRSVEGWGA